MIKYESFEILIDLLKSSYEECERINDCIYNLTSNKDTRSMYLKFYDIASEYIIRILEIEGESREGAEWFVYDGLNQIENGGTEIEDDGKIFKIKTIKDYYDYLKQYNTTN